MTYIPEDEFKFLKSRLQTVVDQVVARTGRMPGIVTIRLRRDDEGQEQGIVDFILVQGANEQLVYETPAVMEVDGVPNQVLRMLVK